MAKQLITDERFDIVDVQLAEINKQLDRTTTVAVQGFERIDKPLDDKASKADMQRVYNYLDKVIQRQEINDDERLMMGHQLDRLDRWVHEVAKKIGYELTV